MNSNLLLTLNSPSDFYTSVVNGLRARITHDVDVLRYAKFSSHEVSGIQLYVEVTGFDSAVRHADGRRAQRLQLTVHCLVSRGIEEADLKALDLASAVDRIVDVNCWGLGNAVEVPENLSANEGMISTGENAFEGWEVSWYQTIFLGESSVFDPEVKKVLVSVNSSDESDCSEYEVFTDDRFNQSSSCSSN